MNQKIHELLEGIELYVYNIEEKNKNDKVTDEVLEKIINIHKQLGELDISIKASDENKIKAEFEKWQKIWNEYGKSKDTCILDVSHSDVNNPETFCDWLEKIATTPSTVTTTASDDKKFIEFWSNHIINNVKFNEIKANVLSLYKEYLSQYVDTLFEIKANDDVENNFLGSKEFKKFNNITLNILTEGLKLGNIKSNEYDEIVEKFGIKATEEDINKLVADEIPAKPTDIPPIGKKYTWDAKAKLWVLTDAV
jgi:hypothetical protein